MASILLSYVASNNVEAKRLLTVLEGAGHSVYGTDPDRPALQDTDIIVAIWSPEALTSPYVYEQARVALSSHCLVQVAAANLDVAQLPAVFRTHILTPIADTKAVLADIERVIGTRPREPSAGPEMAAFKTYGAEPIPQASEEDEEPGPAAAPGPAARRLSSPDETPPAAQKPPSIPATKKEPGSAAAAQRVRLTPMRRLTSPDATPPAAQKPPPIPITKTQAALGALAQAFQPAMPPHLSKTALEKEAGQLNHRVPDRMRVGATEIVEVRLGRVHQDIATGLLGSGALTAEELPIVETMTVDLYGSPDAFRITRRSRPTQLVKSSLIWNEPFDDQRFGRWLWHVTPKKSGTHELVVKVSADMSDSRGVATTEPYGDRMFRVKVRVNLGQASVRVLKWTAVGAVSGLAGAYTHEIWWPKLKALLAGTGLPS